MKDTGESQRQQKRANITSKSTDEITHVTYIQAQRTTTIYLHTGIARNNYLITSYLFPQHGENKMAAINKMAAMNKMAVIQQIIHDPKNSE